MRYLNSLPWSRPRYEVKGIGQQGWNRVPYSSSLWYSTFADHFSPIFTRSYIASFHQTLRKISRYRGQLRNWFFKVALLVYTARGGIRPGSSAEQKRGFDYSIGKSNYAVNGWMRFGIMVSLWYLYCESRLYIYIYMYAYIQGVPAPVHFFRHFDLIFSWQEHRIETTLKSKRVPEIFTKSTMAEFILWFLLELLIQE